MLWLGRALPPISGLLLLLATWLPWVTLRVHVDFGHGIPSAIEDWQMSADTPIVLLGFRQISSPLTRLVAGLLVWAWEFASLSGVLLGLFLLRQRFPAKIPTIFYGVWLTLASAATLPVTVNLLTTLQPRICAETCAPVPVLARTPQPGLWMALGGLALGWIAVGLYIRTRMTGSAVAATSAGARAGYSSPHKAGALITLVGGALWAVGLYAVPWVTSGCTGLHLSFNHFVRGTCSGLDGYDMLGVFMSGLFSWVLLKIVSSVGLFVLISSWLPRLARTTWIVALAWGLMTTLLFAFGLRGTQETVGHAPSLLYGAPPWEPSYGVAICAVGIALGFVGTVLLARDETAGG